MLLQKKSVRSVQKKPAPTPGSVSSATRSGTAPDSALAAQPLAELTTRTIRRWQDRQQIGNRESSVPKTFPLEQCLDIRKEPIKLTPSKSRHPETIIIRLRRKRLGDLVVKSLNGTNRIITLREDLIRPELFPMESPSQDKMVWRRQPAWHWTRRATVWRAKCRSTVSFHWRSIIIVILFLSLKTLRRI